MPYKWKLFPRVSPQGLVPASFYSLGKMEPSGSSSAGKLLKGPSGVVTECGFGGSGPKVGGQGFISEPGLSREPAVWESDPGTGRGELPRGWRAQGQRVAVGRGVERSPAGPGGGRGRCSVN